MRSNVKGVLCVAMAFVLGCHPTLSVAAQSERDSVIRGDGYEIRSNWDGTETLTFNGELETLTSSETADIQSLVFDEQELENPLETEELNLETHIEGSGENTNVTMEYGDYIISFSPEISEGAQDMGETIAENVEVQEGVKTFSGSEEESEEPETEVNLPQTEPETNIEKISME